MAAELEAKIRATLVKPSAGAIAVDNGSARFAVVGE
jgi:hypothetical protein